MGYLEIRQGGGGHRARGRARPRGRPVLISRAPWWGSGGLFCFKMLMMSMTILTVLYSQVLGSILDKVYAPQISRAPWLSEKAPSHYPKGAFCAQGGKHDAMSPLPHVKFTS